jgi:outer membrane lipoprotein-sorting protein
MGSLSGAGNPDRFHVFNKRIYIFASESCRNSFKKNPDVHIETADAVPMGSAAEKKRGQELIALALNAFGGASKVDGVKNYQAKIKLGYKQGDKVLEYPQTMTIAFPNLYRNEYNWGPSQTGDVLLPTGAVSLTTKNSESDAWQREEPVKVALERALYREPLAILKARKEKGFVAFAAGKAKVGETEVELLKVGFKGATSTLGIDTKTGQILQVAYRDRKGAYGDVVKTFSDFREVSGLTLPFGIAENFNGKDVTSPMTSIESIAVNINLDAKLFQKP